MSSKEWCAVGRNNFAKKHGTPPNKELTGGVDGLGLLVFLMCSTYGRYIDPDQQGDT